MTFARRVDGNHEAVIDALRQCGWKVKDTSRLAGWIDLVAWHPGRQALRLIEVKVKGGTYTPLQQQLLDESWPITTLYSVDDATRL
jgi:hypothetical protein